MKINKPFRYMGSKGRFYNEIKKIFEESGKKKYVDLFAGGMEVALNLKEDFEDIDILVNVRDEHIESLLKNKDTVLKRVLELVEFLYQGTEKRNSRDIYEEKETWNKLKERYKKFWLENPLNFSSEEKLYIELLYGLNKGRSLTSSFYSSNKLKTLEIYLQKIEDINIKTDFFNKKWEFNNSFILLDPPYVTSTRVDKKEEKGYNYKGNWKEENDKELIEFIKNNLNKNNVFLLFGSVGNPLSKMVRKEFQEIDFVIKQYRKSIFGKTSLREEWYCLIK